MARSEYDDVNTRAAASAHLGAVIGPVIPAAIYLARRHADRFSAEESAKALNFSVLVVSLFVAGTLVRLLVPFVGFLGTLAQWVVPLVGAYFCVMAWRGARLGTPATYPFQFKVVKTDD